MKRIEEIRAALQDAPTLADESEYEAAALERLQEALDTVERQQRRAHWAIVAVIVVAAAVIAALAKGG